MRKVKIEKNPEDNIPFEVMERSLVQISDSLSKINKTRISRKMIVALIQDDTKIGKGIIETVLNSFESLETQYLKKKNEK